MWLQKTPMFSRKNEPKPLAVSWLVLGNLAPCAVRDLDRAAHREVADEAEKSHPQLGPKERDPTKRIRNIPLPPTRSLRTQSQQLADN